MQKLTRDLCTALGGQVYVVVCCLKMLLNSRVLYGKVDFLACWADPKELNGVDCRI
jgi:hypothetical protein